MSYQAQRYTQKKAKKSQKKAFVHGCSDKFRYRSKEMATEHLVAIRYHALAGVQQGALNTRIPIRAYQCDNCGGGWHLTSREDRYAIKFELAA
jgi:hypothetical protein